jgi:hypothetical protein
MLPTWLPLPIVERSQPLPAVEELSDGRPVANSNKRLCSVVLESSAAAVCAGVTSGIVTVRGVAPSKCCCPMLVLLAVVLGLEVLVGDVQLIPRWQVPVGEATNSSGFCRS